MKLKNYKYLFHKFVKVYKLLKSQNNYIVKLKRI
jgi:hypothetical protein